MFAKRKVERFFDNKSSTHNKAKDSFYKKTAAVVSNLVATSRKTE